MVAVVVVSLAGCRVNFDRVEDSADAAPDGAERTTSVSAMTTGAGTGRIVGTASGIVIDCANCTQEVPPGTTIRFTAVEEGGSWFRGWTQGCPGRRSCDLVVGDVPLTVTADFTAEPNRIFMSAGTHAGNLLAAGSGDAFCTSSAAVAGLPGTYHALVSTAATGVNGWTARLSGARGWIRVDGQPVADLALDLQGGMVRAGITLTESGGTVPETERFWALHRNVGATSFCQDWTTNSAAQASFAIDSIRGSNYGNGGGQFTCDTLQHVICAQVDHAVAVQPVPDPGRKAFTSSVNWDTTTGLAAADALCTSEATAASLPGSFRAFLAMPGASAVSRFDLTKAPWVRPDGSPLLSSVSAWSTAPQVDVGLNLAADGTNLSVGNIVIGATDPGAAGTLATTCDGWTANTTSALPIATWNTKLRVLATGSGGCGPGSVRLIWFGGTRISTSR